MSIESDDKGETAEAKTAPQKVSLVKPPKRLNEMTEEERRAWSMSLGEALKKKFAEQQKDKD